MIKTKTKKIEVNVLEDIICDSCGKSCKNSINYEYMTLKNYWGYGSKKDGEFWEAHICEKCVDNKLQFIKFKKIDCLTEMGGLGVQDVETKIINPDLVIISE